jgi:tetratricopeptide (TPR) repeat protein
MALFRTNLSLTTLLLAAGLSASLSAVGRAEEPTPPQISDDIADLINNDLRPASDAKEWDKALGIIEKGLSKAAADSYDAAVLYQIKAQTLFQKSSTSSSDALVALERCLAIDDQHHYFTEKSHLETLYLVAQLNYQEGAAIKDPKRRAAFYTKSDQALERWIKDNKEFTPENCYFIAVLYFSRGQPEEETPGVEPKADAALMEKALYWTDRDLYSTIRPRDSVYQLKLAELFQLGRYSETAELLELLVTMKPENKSYWQQLASSYQQLATTATEKKDDRAAYSYNIRIILTIERAQKLGIMNSPKDNYNLVGIYFNIGQFSEACRLLEQGLRDGSIERTRPNYELLANSYQQLHREYKAIETLKDAAKVFPHSGQIEYQIAQVYFTIDKYKEAFEHMKVCEAKGGTEKPHIGWLFYAYLALDLKEYDEAIKAVAEAAKYPEAKTEAARMEDAIKATLQDRENRLNSQ